MPISRYFAQLNIRVRYEARFSVMHDWKAQLNPRRSWIGFLLAAGIILTALFTVLNPRASDGLDFFSRLLFWGLHVFIPLSVAQFFQVLFSRHLNVPMWPSIAVSGVFAALVFAPLAGFLDLWFPVNSDDAGSGFGTADAVEEFVRLLPPVVLCWAALNAVRVVRLNDPSRGRPKEVPQLIQLLPKELFFMGEVEVLALSAELHYTRVFTANGDDLVLYPFSKAMDDAGDGLQIHRSHWVSRAQVRVLDSDRKGWEVELKNGLRFPVARSRRKAVAQALDGEPFVQKV